jgi:hypothetical protein
MVDVRHLTSVYRPIKCIQLMQGTATVSTRLRSLFIQTDARTQPTLTGVLGIKRAAVVLIQTACLLRKRLRQRSNFGAAGGASLPHFLLPFLFCVSLYISPKPLNLFFILAACLTIILSLLAASSWLCFPPCTHCWPHYDA